MKPVYYRHELWEDYKIGMYAKQCHPSGVSAAYCILKDPVKLYDAMYYVSHHWPYSSEMNLTNSSMNRQAWLGQAACAWMVHATDEETKTAWRALTKEEQDRANAVANRIINEWEIEYAEKTSRH